MKKIFLSLLTLFFTSIAFAQNDSIQPPYKRFPSFPPVKLLLPDSTTSFTKADLDKKKPTMLMLFNPQCVHCQHETGTGPQFLSGNLLHDTEPAVPRFLR